MYELVDTHTGNWIGAHATEEEALRSVADIIRRWGEDAVANVALGRFELGSEGVVIAQGEQLVQLARTPA
jgi:hypothetical protein